MKAHLMFEDSDFDLNVKLPWNERALSQDLELQTLFGAMALGDEFILKVVRSAVLSGLTNNPDTIRYRQNVLKDCLKNPTVVRDIYNIAVEAIESKRRYHFGFFISRYPGSILIDATGMMQIFVTMLRRLKEITDKHAGRFESASFNAFFAMIRKEIDAEYLARVQSHLKELKFNDGVLISAELGAGNEGTGYVLRRPRENNQGWVQRIFAPKPRTYTFCISERDETGARTLSELRNRGINNVANAIAQSAEHIDNFFGMLRLELAFYIGGLNLNQQLADRGESMTFPVPADSGEYRHTFRGLFDVCLALTTRQRVVGNELNADGKCLVVITGANQGGKSTFLRSVGLAQMMMQCGLFVPAETFSSSVCSGLFTHYRREEDTAMKSGKLDEELIRMSDIADNVNSSSMVLFNESFAATNEREGSEIARQIVCALLEKLIRVFFVSHFYEFAHGLFEKKMERAVFLRAERQENGGRTYKVLEGMPLQTSYGEDLYDEIFENDSYQQGER